MSNENTPIGILSVAAGWAPCSACGTTGYQGGTVYHKQYTKCPQCGGAGDTPPLTAGRYRREWAGYTVDVEIRKKADGSLEEVAPSGLCSDPASMPDAKWFALPNVPDEPRE